MTKQELIDKIIEIKWLVSDVNGVTEYDNNSLDRVSIICSDIELEWKFENAKCLEKEEK